MSDAWLIVGLGNPGRPYANTRHNAGARAIELLAGSLGGKLKATSMRAIAADLRRNGIRMILARPTTFMNESGEAVSSLLSKYHVSPDRMIVIHDDIDLGSATLRVKFGGGTGGNHGIESIASVIKTQDFFRVRVGVGRPLSVKEDPAEYVLRPMARKDAKEMSRVEEDAGQAALTIIDEGLEVAMNRFNSKGTGAGGRGAIPRTEL